MSTFKNRVFGCAIVKARNANYNADFTHQPRTLSDGTLYATDKAFKYTIRNYLDKSYPDEKIFYFKRLKENLNPRDLDEMYKHWFGDYPKKAKKNKDQVLKNIMSCLDIRLFGATFAGEVNISVHGPAQINHGVNRYPDAETYTEQIMSPFRSDQKGSEKEGASTTLGSQSKVTEAHYVHHFSINPNTLDSVYEVLDGDSDTLTQDDINKFKEACLRGATAYESSSKAGIENELLLWVQLKEGAKKVLPSFTDLVDVIKENGKVQVDLERVTGLVEKLDDELESVELFYNDAVTSVINAPENATTHDLI